MPVIRNPIFAHFTLSCTQDGCGGMQKVEQAASAGLTLGSMVPVDPQNPAFGRCPKCRRNSMKVMEVPAPRRSQSQTGFTKIPTK